jgi:cobalamin biosynthesis Mg chelatase CobN
MLKVLLNGSPRAKMKNEIAAVQSEDVDTESEQEDDEEDEEEDEEADDDDEEEDDVVDDEEEEDADGDDDQTTAVRTKRKRTQAKPKTAKKSKKAQTGSTSTGSRTGVYGPGRRLSGPKEGGVLLSTYTRKSNFHATNLKPSMYSPISFSVFLIVVHIVVSLLYL